MALSERVTIKLLVDKEKSRVVLAESKKDFVDILFSFLTLPLGTIIRILGNNSSSLGCLANIYESVAKLESRYLQTEACRNMLLRPRNAAAVQCEDLTINIDDTKSRIFYFCHECGERAGTTFFFYSSVPNTRCGCERLMNHIMIGYRTDLNANGDGVFVKGVSKFVITDDLNVSLPSTDVLTSLFKSLSIEDGSMLEQRSFDLCKKEIAYLLWRSLISKNPLTDLCFSKPDKDDASREQDMKDKIQPKHESDIERSFTEVQLKLVLNKSDNKVLYAEVEDLVMVNFLFSLLTFPLGLLIKDNNFFSKGCIGNLYNSVENNSFTMSDECKSLLLFPKLATFHGCSGPMLKIEEMPSNTRTVPEYYWYGRLARMKEAILTELNPKSPNCETKQGGGYAKGLEKFMVTDDLHVLPFSLISSVQIMNEFKVSASDLLEKEVSMGAAHALELLRAAFSSQTALTDVFATKKKQKRLTCFV